jgi:hypothetical protein
VGRPGIRGSFIAGALVVLAVSVLPVPGAATTALPFWSPQNNSQPPAWGGHLPESSAMTCGAELSCDPFNPPPGSITENQTGALGSSYETGVVLAYVQDAINDGYSCGDTAWTYSWNGKSWTQLVKEDRVIGQFCGVKAVTMSQDAFGIVRVEPCANIECIYRWNDGWQLLNPATSPPARYYANVAYNPTTRRMVLFGGGGAPGCLNDTWTWDGSTWTQRFPSSHPPGCAIYQAMARDPQRGMMLFEGVTDTTWRWDGTTWVSLVTPKHPPKTGPYETYCIAYDPATNQDVLTLQNQTWTWSGTAWQQKLLGAVGPGEAPCTTDWKRAAALSIGSSSTYLWRQHTL